MVAAYLIYLFQIRSEYLREMHLLQYEGTTGNRNVGVNVLPLIPRRFPARKGEFAKEYWETAIYFGI